MFGMLPSLTWLSFYLTKDLHPEPRKMIIKMFLWGSFITLPVFFIQTGLTSLLNGIPVSPLLTSVIYWFIVVSFTEELFKFLVVKMKVVDSPHLDEPLDLMIYMVVVALGFAAVENILYSFAPIGHMSVEQVVTRTLVIAFVRFVGATFLHTLCSALIGYAMAISFKDKKRAVFEMISGIILATLLHGLYDFSIMTLDGSIKYVVPGLIIITLAFLVFAGFEKLKKVKSVTILN